MKKTMLFFLGACLLCVGVVFTTAYADKPITLCNLMSLETTLNANKVYIEPNDNLPNGGYKFNTATVLFFTADKDGDCSSKWFAKGVVVKQQHITCNDNLKCKPDLKTVTPKISITKGLLYLNKDISLQLTINNPGVFPNSLTLKIK